MSYIFKSVAVSTYQIISLVDHIMKKNAKVLINFALQAF